MVKITLERLKEIRDEINNSQEKFSEEYGSAHDVQHHITMMEKMDAKWYESYMKYNEEYIRYLDNDKKIIIPPWIKHIE